MAHNTVMTIEDYGTVIYKCYAGSRSYGTNITEEDAKKIAELKGGDWKEYASDVDIRGIFIPHPKYLYGTNAIDEFRCPIDEDTVYFSLQKFITLAIECNPNVVEQLFVRDEDILFMNEYGKELRDMRHLFLSKNAYARFASYAHSQLKRMTPQDEGSSRNEKRQRIIEMAEDKGGIKYDSKNAMHLVRLYRMGIEILRYGQCHTFRPDAKELLGIRNGDLTLEEVHQLADSYEKEIEEVLHISTIPDVPDFETINRWVMRVVDLVHGNDPSKGVYTSKKLNLLPVEFEMVDDTTLFLVSNPLIRKKSYSEAQGFFIPYKDWFTGLRTCSEFKFDKSTIEHIHKFSKQLYACNPRHIDIVFAESSSVLIEKPIVSELMKKLRTLPSKKTAFHTTHGFSNGNLRKMQHWEQLKEKHEKFKFEILEAKKLSEEHWQQTMETLEKERYQHGADDFRAMKNKLVQDYQKWQELSKKKSNQPFYPSVPDGTPTESASMMTKYGYDTILASEIIRTLKNGIELLSSGTIVNSRVHETECYSIKHGKYKTFNDFKDYTETLISDLIEANKNATLKTTDYDKFTVWLINYIQKYHETLTKE